jgi:hypothetical protein
MVRAPPAIAPVSDARPKVPHSGMTTIATVSDPMPNAVATSAAWSAIERCRWSTIFGRLVVPDVVNTTYASSASPTGSTGSPARQSGGSSVIVNRAPDRTASSAASSSLYRVFTDTRTQPAAAHPARSRT